MSYAGEGNLAGAQKSLQQVSSTINRADLAAYVASYWDTYWILDSADAALVQTENAALYDGDRATWALTRAELFWLHGDTARARASADISYAAAERVTPENAASWQGFLLRAYMLAVMGKREHAISDRDRGLAGAIASGDQWSVAPYSHHMAARIDVVLGDRDGAIAELRELLSKPYFISPAWLRIDPTWDPLRGDARFEKLAHSDGR